MIQLHHRPFRSPFNNGRFGQVEFAFDQYGNFFSSFVPATPPKKTTLTSVLGLHTHFNIGLSPEHLYQQQAYFHRQGDILNAEQDVFERLNILAPDLISTSTWGMARLSRLNGGNFPNPCHPLLRSIMPNQIKKERASDSCTRSMPST